ncbi:MAG: ribosomal RNA small subunit methyltransferase A [Luteitalea sp.]|nr:ribosomal RNA small subunit methyltransferase A [Luteitalea sp.]
MTASHRPLKRFGQNFLESAWAEKLVRSIDPQADQTFVEIGPGRGAITLPLARSARHVVAFEIDRDLAADLRATLPGNVTIVEGDFLDLTAPELVDALRRCSAEGPIRVAGNLPYNVASPILFKLTELVGAGVPLADAAVMLQREVADRLLAAPGTRDYGVLTVLIGHVAAVDRLLQLPAGAFRPQPKVLSTVVRLRFQDPHPAVVDPRVFAGMTQAMFTRRRKTIANALLAYGSPAGIAPEQALAAAGIDPQRRPETLAIAEIAALSDAYANARRRAVL